MYAITDFTAASEPQSTTEKAAADANESKSKVHAKLEKA